MFVFDIKIAKNNNFDNEKNDEIIDRNNETENFDSKTNKTINWTNC